MTKSDERSINLQKEILKSLLFLNYQEDNLHPNLIIVIGGDGTFIDAIREYNDSLDKVKFICFNTGILGYYNDFKKEDLEHLENYLTGKVGFIEELTMLETKIADKTYKAINEFILLNQPHNIYYNVYIDGILLEEFFGSGLLLSTPTGSTAYNRSLRGAILDTYLDAFELTEIAAINSSKYLSVNNPVVFRDSHKIIFEAKKEQNVMLTCDNQVIDISKIEKIEFYKSSSKVYLITKEKDTFISRLKKAL